ncbi:MAG: cytochrome c [Burkholderiaceae bacterium]|nr:cytochrome c [Burkholderiaceae bacterium]
MPLCVYAQPAAQPVPAPPPARQTQIAHLLRDDCGACHGMTLKGGLGWPLTRVALAGKPAEFLVQTVLQGRPGTAMPPWAPFLSEPEVRWLIQQLQAGTPPAVPPPATPIP